MTSVDEITIAEIQARDPRGMPIHIARDIMKLLNAKVAAVALELGWIEEVESELHPEKERI